MTKDELREELERQAQRYMQVQGGEVITYAAQPEPERRPWRKRSNVLNKQFDQELEKIAKEHEARSESEKDTDM